MRWLLIVVCLLAMVLVLPGCEGDDGNDGAPGTPGADGVDGKDGLPGSALIDASTVPDFILETFEVESEITAVSIASPPVVEFAVKTSDGLPITGIGALWQASDRFVRFTIAKLVPGTNGDPDSWVAYTRDVTNDGSTRPDYDTGTLVDNGDGTYVFTFNTDVANVSGVPYEPSLTHRVAGQIGSSSSALKPQNLFLDFIPDGSPVTNTRNIAVIESCNECHEGLLFHGRRFIVEYCVNCHNPDLALTESGVAEGNMSFMIHRLHRAGAFDVLDGGFESEATYPQDVRNCRKCHNGDDAATPEGFNWKNMPNLAGCGGCHTQFEDGTHTGGPQSDNSGCAGCHPSDAIEGYHQTNNVTPNNPSIPDDQRAIAYELLGAAAANGQLTVDFRISSDGEPLDMNSLPSDLALPGRWPGFRLAYALPQSGIDEPADYNNLGESGGQPLSADIGDLVDAGEVTCSDGICTAVFADPIPAGATLRAVGLQGYFRQDVDEDGTYEYALHTTSVVIPLDGDTPRRVVVDNEKCAACHEFFEGHGGNRNYDIAICAMCHVPNLTSSGRAVDPVDAENRPSDAFEQLGLPTTDWPEDTNNLKDMIHGIHASAQRSTDYEFVRGRNDGIYYDWAHVTFPAEEGTRNCLVCHLEGTYELPLAGDLLPTTVRTTTAADGLDTDFNIVDAARDTVPNDSDWVNSITASTCYYCHDSELAAIHMSQNGGFISVANPDVGEFTQRQELDPAESCAVCHGPGKSADVNVVHGLE
ncbi:OmcA/MtrC family decaheme c-type cytochrome [Desulfuromonas sp.]|uniref:OmcA/MtrC family decaheme c-type cytochrome n=1 Tax=Desulfuromonas sp. TaxID=892 RepID=UPI0025BD07D8|nr:OmcA/MtrC family decaheme c-type cytochrome [Desulfuromonas sp.]